jgi:hypothetical protein
MTYQTLSRDNKQKAIDFTEELNELLRKYNFHLESSELHYKNLPVAFIDDYKTYISLLDSETETIVHQTKNVEN